MKRAAPRRREWHWRGAALAAALFVSAGVQARGPFEVWKDCQLEANASNDGDSFHVKASGKGYILRLYLVDAPETDAGFPERVAEQGKYFGISPTQAVELGASAKKFVDEKLARPFTVRTSRQNAMGRSNKQRYYAFVATNEGDLGELLVANGLARVHGVAPAKGDPISTPGEKEKLTRLELDARKQKVGGWGASAGRMNARLLAPAKKLDSFDSFFHPERAVAAPPRTLPELAPTPPPVVVRAPASVAPPPLPARPSADGLLDPNTATVANV